MFSSKKIFLTNNNSNTSSIVVRIIDQISGQLIDNSDILNQGTGIVHLVDGKYFWGKKEGFTSIAGFHNSSSVVDYQPLDIKKNGENFVLTGLKSKSKGDNHWITLYSNGYYPRITFVDIPFSGGTFDNPLEIPLIPTSFNIQALNELVRDNWYTEIYDNSLQRWIEKPRIVVSNKLLSFSQGPPWQNSYFVQDGSILQNINLEVTINEIVSNINSISPWTYSPDEIEIVTPSIGTYLKQNKTIFIAYYNDIMTWSAANSTTTAAGYGAFSTFSSYVTSGHAMIDYNYSSKYRTLIHEIGHCLGYNHVKSTTSIMNSPSKPITLFDNQVKDIVYTRSLRNKSDDTDHPSYSISSKTNFPYLYETESGGTIYFPNMIPLNENFVNNLNYSQINDQDIYDYIIGCGVDGKENKLIYKNNQIYYSSS